MTVRSGYAPAVAGTYPISRLGGRLTTPSSGRTRPTSARNTVDFPAPSPPTSTVIVPGSTLTVTEASASRCR